jgi:hypothetical protein
MDSDFRADIDAVEAIAAVPTILNVVCRVTGMGFAAVARVTPERWVCLAVNDEIAFGLQPGGSRSTPRSAMRCARRVMRW